jgi:hypothetical protein
VELVETGEWAGRGMGRRGRKMVKRIMNGRVFS